MWPARVVGPQDPLFRRGQSIWWALREAAGRLEGEGRSESPPRCPHPRAHTHTHAHGASASPWNVHSACRVPAAVTNVSGWWVVSHNSGGQKPNVKDSGLGEPSQGGGGEGALWGFLPRGPCSTDPAPPREPPPHTITLGVRTQRCTPGTMVWSAPPGLVSRADVGQAGPELGTATQMPSNS